MPLPPAPASTRLRAPVAFAASVAFSLVAAGCAAVPRDIDADRDARRPTHADAPTPPLENPFLAPVYPSSDAPANAPDAPTMEGRDGHGAHPATQPASPAAPATMPASLPEPPRVPSR